MLRRVLELAACAALIALPSVYAADAQPKCDVGKCPQSAPCCSPYGACGVGAYCLGGCDPRHSFSLKSCVPAPTCQSKDFKLTSLDDVSDISSYLGDASKINWVTQGKPVVYNNNAILLTMAPDTVGTLMSSTHYVWYGKISATLTTSKGAGVVTAFILMSDTKDEIDYEWVGVDLQNVQTNYYSQGVTNYNNGANISAANTDTVTHTYTIDWTPDQITWAVDGKDLRVKKRSDTWNSTSNRWDFPQTPSRIQLSLWPAGLPSNAAGTIAWAGGQINWNSPDMKNGYYYAIFNEIKVECYDPPAGYQKSGSKAYIYTDTIGTNKSVKMVDDLVVLKSLYASGEDPGQNPNGKDADAAKTIPGVVGIGTRGDLPGGSDNAASGSGVTNGFTQGTSKNAAAKQDIRLGGSSFAVLVAILLGCFWL